MLNLSLAALGGALGAALRYLAGQAALKLMGPGFPWGTLFVNISGSLLMGILFTLLVRHGTAGGLSIFLLTGVLGGFTTFSAFSLEAAQLWERGAAGAMAGYIAGSVLLSVGALFLGLWAAETVIRQ